MDVGPVESSTMDSMNHSAKPSAMKAWCLDGSLVDAADRITCCHCIYTVEHRYHCTGTCVSLSTLRL